MPLSAHSQFLTKVCERKLTEWHACRQWRERRAEEIKARDEASKAKRQETISKAEASIDTFYEEYALKKERNIRENKCVSLLFPPSIHLTFGL